MQKKLILIVGLAGSGKSTISRFIKDKFNADIFHTGDIIREEVRRRELERTTKNEILIANWFFANRKREKIIIERIAEKIKKSNKKIIVIEGLTTYENLKYLEKLVEIKPIVLSIITTLNVRVKRESKRGRFGKKRNIEYVKSRDDFEKSRGIGKLMKKADYTIDNSRLSKKQANDKVYKLIKEILDWF
jgi:dephospho-CoA kinase